MEPIELFFQISNGVGFLDFNKWDKLDLSKFGDKIAPLEKNVTGLYAIFYDRFENPIYIGKGKSIHSRLKSHYNLTKNRIDNTRKRKYPAWEQFFQYFNNNLKAYYFKIDFYDIKDPEIQENIRGALERIVQIKYRPLFDLLYPRRTRMEPIDDFISTVRKLTNINLENIVN